MEWKLRFMADGEWGVGGLGALAQALFVGFSFAIQAKKPFFFNNKGTISSSRTLKKVLGRSFCCQKFCVLSIMNPENP